MTGGGPFYDRYTVNGHDEWRMRIGAPGAPALLFLPPLFEELNRTRALIATTMRMLAARRFTCFLPDLPGTGESERALKDVTLEDWREAARAAAPDARAVVSLRGGALFNDVASCVWRLSPADGSALVRDLERAGAAAGDGSLAGYAPSAALLEPLRNAVPAEVGRVRTVRLASDPRPADSKLDFPPPWRRAEPESSCELAEAIASDIESWVRQCGAC